MSGSITHLMTQFEEETINNIIMSNAHKGKTDLVLQDFKRLWEIEHKISLHLPLLLWDLPPSSPESFQSCDQEP
jgi:hypothetical protein